MTRLEYARAFLLLFYLGEALSSEISTYTINTKKWSHVLDDHFISVTINPTDLLQGKAFGLGMNSTVAILKGLSPAYIRIGSADTGKYTFKRSRFPSEGARTEDEFIITESHWTTLNEVARSAGLDVIVCLNAAHRNGASNKWDTRNSLELISFSDSQGYNLTFQLGYEIQRSSGLSGRQYGRDLKRLRTILNAFPRYQNSKLIGPDIRYLQRKEDVEFVNDVLSEGGSVLDAITWHPRWPQPSKMKVSDISELGYEFPTDYLEWDRSQLGRILQRSILKNSIWIGEPKTESTGTFAEGLLWARRLVLAGKLGIEVVMKQPSLMDISHPKPEYWIAYLHKRLLGKAVLETRAANNQTDMAVITHCTNPLFWSERSSKAVDGAVTIYAVNMGGKDQRVHIKGNWGGKSQIMLQYLLTSGSDPDSVFSQMTYLNGEPLMMSDDGELPDVTPRVRRIDRGVLFKLPPYSVGFWVIPEAKVKVCQVQPAPVMTPDVEILSSGIRQKNIPNIRNLNQLIVDKLKNPISESDEEFYDDRTISDFSSEGDLMRESVESPGTRSSRRVRQITVEDIGQELKQKIREIRDMLETKKANKDVHPAENLRAAEEKITSLTEELGAATRLSNQQEEFGRFLHKSGLNQDFGALMVNDRMGMKRSIRNNPLIKPPTTFDPFEAKVRRFRRSLSSPEDDYEEESTESYSSEEENFTKAEPTWTINYRKRIPGPDEVSDENNDNSDYSGTPVLKGIDEKYRTILAHRIQDGKRKLNDLRRQRGNRLMMEEPKKPKVKKPNNLGSNDLQEEILMKEVEVLQKTEEAMTNLIKNHKKRQQTIQEIILHEITDIKEDRLSALQDIRNQKELDLGENEEKQEDLQKRLRPVEEILHYPQKIKRSIEVGESSVNTLPEEEKKSKIEKRSVDSSYEKSRRRRKSRKSRRDDEDDESEERGRRRLRKSRSERLERMKNFIQSRERIRDRNMHMKKHNRNLRKHKMIESDEESNEITAHTFLNKPEDKVIKELQKEILKKPEREDVKTVHEEVTKKEKKVEEEQKVEKQKPVKKEEKNEDNPKNGSDKISDKRIDNNTENQKSKSKMEDKSQSETTTPKIPVKKVKVEEQTEMVPLKIDKNRGINMLKRISNLVENINTREKAKSKKPSMDVEDLSDEFFGDSISKISKRRHRRSHHHGGYVRVPKAIEQQEEEAEASQKTLKELRALRREMKLRKIMERRMKKKKMKEENNEGEHSEGHSLKSKLKNRLHLKNAEQVSSEAGMEEEPRVEMEGPQRIELGTEEVEMEESSQKKETDEQIVAEVQNATDDVKTEENGETNTDSGLEQVVAKETPQVEEKKEDNPELVEQPTEQPTTEQTPQEESTQSVTDKVAAVRDEKIEEPAQESVTEAVKISLENTQEAEVQQAISIEPTPTAVTTEQMSEVITEQPAEPENPRAILMIPEIEGLVLNPLIIANPPEEMPLQQDEESSESLKDRYVLLDEYQEEDPRVELFAGNAEGEEEEEEEQRGPPDVIAELMQGDKLKPWKGAIMDTVKNLRSKIDEMRTSRKRSYYADDKDETSPSDEEYDDESSEETPADKAKSESKILKRSRRGIFERRPQNPEDRIRSFKRMVHRRHTPFVQKNEIPIIREGENFWKMAGSTVKAVFNDVIPEAYGKTKTKIENLGIAEYFKEFGKIVEQMKNLDKLFANIGQSAVRNYIKGTEDERGDYIQVIEKRRRSRRDVNEDIPQEEEKSLTNDVTITLAPDEPKEEEKTVTPILEVTTEKVTEKKVETTTPAGPWIRGKGLKKKVKERPNDLFRDIFFMDSNPGIVEVTKRPSSTEPPQTISLQPFESRYAKTNNIHNRFMRRDQMTDVQMPEMNKFAPWMKTTKEFINQALTTLQRQRELSEMIARESVNDLVKRQIERKVIGKRDTGEDRRILPVYQMPNRKREIYAHPEEAIVRYPSQLQPGVYIVPTEEMQNLRSEQIMKEAPPTKPGMPNMVTLNIYYDKKKPQEWEASKEVLDAEKVDGEIMRYYPEPTYSWNPVPAMNHVPEYLPEPAIETRYLPQQYPIEQKMHDPRLLPYGETFEWIPRYPPAIPRSQTPYLYPESQFVHPKNEWQEYKHPIIETGTPGTGDSGWAVQFQPVKKKATRHRDALRTVERQQRLLPDKKRSVGSKTDTGFPGLALPFWKFATAKKQPEAIEKNANSESSESLEALFAENRRRARLNEARKKEESHAEEEEKHEVAEMGETEKPEAEIGARRRRSVPGTGIDSQNDSDWTEAIQEVDNSLRDYRNNFEMKKPVNEIEFNYYEEEETLEDRRKKRSLDGKILPDEANKKQLKKLTDEDSSLEVPNGNKNPANPVGMPAKEKTESGDPLSKFIKYAYDSLIKVMKEMAGHF